MIPTSALFDQSVITALLAHDPVVCDYCALFPMLDWSMVDQWQAARSPRRRPAHPQSAYLKAFLIRIQEGFIYTTQLRAFLVKHPLLGVERPKVRNGHAVKNLNTLIYLVMNIRALAKAKSINRGLLQMN